MVDSPQHGLPEFALTHGQARWLLAVLYGGTGRPDMDLELDPYLKYLRREGLPFSTDELGVGRGNRILYHYRHLMELAVAFYLKSQALLPKQVVHLLADLRDELRPIYDRAYREAESGLGQAVHVQVDDVKLVTMSGISLDLGLSEFGFGTFVTGGHPCALGPRELITWFATQGRSQLRQRSPVPLSDLARRIAELAPHAPAARRGRG